MKNKELSTEFISDIYIYFLVSFNLLYFGFAGYSAIFSSKASVFTTVSWVYILFCAAICFVGKKGVLNFKYIMQKLKGARFMALIYAFFTLVSALVSVHFPKTFFGVSRFEGFFTILTYCLVFVCVSSFAKLKKSHYYTLLASSFLFFVVCIIQFMGYNPFNLYPSGATFYDAGRLFPSKFLGTIGNANLVGAFMCLLVPILFFAVIKGRGMGRHLSLLVLILSLYTVFKMDTDSVYVGLAAFFVFALPFIFNMRKKTVILYAVCVIILAIMFVFAVYNSDFDSGLLYELSEILHGNFDDTFGSGRIRIWRNVLSKIPESIIFGKGPDTMILEEFTPFSRYYPDKGRVVTTKIDVAHNEFLNVLYHQGLLGLCSYIFLLLRVFIGWIKSKRTPVTDCLSCACICYLVQSMFGFSMCLSAPYFWVCLALLSQSKSE